MPRNQPRDVLRPPLTAKPPNSSSSTLAHTLDPSWPNLPLPSCPKSHGRRLADRSNLVGRRHHYALPQKACRCTWHSSDAALRNFDIGLGHVHVKKESEGILLYTGLINLSFLYVSLFPFRPRPPLRSTTPSFTLALQHRTSPHPFHPCLPCVHCRARRFGHHFSSPSPPWESVAGRTAITFAFPFPFPLYSTCS